ncbi:MAG: excinuclease ABC subunit UvrA, partial [Bacteroidia bacterium]|nr:excinuclease ABC subunit UvrA [Bacteroidia bacterium]
MTNNKLSEPEEKEIIDEHHDINVLGAKVHNLKNIDINIPRNKLTVITGLSGSGKSSLAFDTIYAEGQRRYIETFSAYARQFIGNLERPDVDQITGLSPVISIEQKSTNKNPRSTVGTITEIYDFLRLLYAKIAIPYSYITGDRMVKYSNAQIISLILSRYAERLVYILAPIIKGRKGHYKELFEQIRKKGFLNVRIDGNMREITQHLKLDRYKTHNIEVVIDKVFIKENFKKRIGESVQTAMKLGNGIIMVFDDDTLTSDYFSRNLMCPISGISYNEPAPHSFSFNSPQGACPKCNGLGEICEIDIKKIIPDTTLSIRNGGIMPLGKYKNILLFWQIEAIARKYHFTLDTPIAEISENALGIILYGSEESFRLENTPLGVSSNYFLNFEGVINYIKKQGDIQQSKSKQKWAQQFINDLMCPVCYGTRLKKESLFFKINEKNIAELSAMEISQLIKWMSNLENFLDDKQKIIATEILKEIRTRLSFLSEVGLEYLSLARNARSLSGGEAQRIRLATQIGSQLVNVLYILDEPSIGLHKRDNRRLIKSLKQLRDNCNTIIIVEHDKETILSADYIIDIGPFAGNLGGNMQATGPPGEFINANTLTA